MDSIVGTAYLRPELTCVFLQALHIVLQRYIALSHLPPQTIDWVPTAIRIMLTLIVVLYYLLLVHETSQAAPSSATLAGAIDLIPPLIARLEPNAVDGADHFNRRSAWNIVWSCLTTIFACTWVAIHPNIPAPTDSCWKILSRRLKLMLRVILLPESVVFWAWRQYYGARQVADKVNQSSQLCMRTASMLNFTTPHLLGVNMAEAASWDEPWTPTHGFFAIMGGFMLCRSDGKPLKTLTPDVLFEYTKEGAIEWPKICEEDIWDRSKGDYLTKGIVILQTAWFVTTCMARAFQRLPITELEVVTLAFATLNVVIYIPWWHKPLDVRRPISVYFKKGYDGPLLQALDNIVPQKIYVPRESGIRQCLHNLLRDVFLMPACVWKSLSGSIGETGLLQLLGDGLTALTWSVAVPLFVDHMDDGTNHADDGTMRVATFAATQSELSNQTRQLIFFSCVIVLGWVFGRIHLVAWSFPTEIEGWIWRVSLLYLIGCPMGIIAMLWICRMVPSNSILEKALSAAGAILMVAYLLARVLLLILPFIAFRSLPPGTLLDINWI